MRKARIALAALIVGIGWAGTASAQQAIPLLIHWDKTQPTRIILQDGGETGALPPPDATKTFTSTVTRPTAQLLFKQVKLIVSYGDIDIPIVVNVGAGRAKVEMWLLFDAPKSCFDRYLYSAEVRADNIVDAMRRMLVAAYVLRIGAPNDCRSVGYEARAIRARVERNQNLSTTSGGLFAINEDWRQELASLPPNTFRTPPAAIARAASAQAIGALVAGLYNVDMKKVGNAADSLAIAKGLETLGANDPAAKAVIDTVPLADTILVYEQRVAND